MSKIIRLTESDLVKLVKRIIEEQKISTNKLLENPAELTNGKNCVQQIRKLYGANGFKVSGIFGDGELHSMVLKYERMLKGMSLPESATIELIDTKYGENFIISSQISSGGFNKGGQARSTKLDLKTKQLFDRRYKVSSQSDSMVNYVSTDLNCETAKTELQRNIKQLEQSLIQMGYKKV
jgi:hypothetical protein